LQQRTRDLEEASRHKSQFLSNMSHELRTPLNAVIGYADLLKEVCEDEGYTDLIKDLVNINTAGKHLLSLINTVLDLPHNEAGRMDLNLDDLDVAVLVQGIAILVAPLVEQRGNGLVVEVAPDV